MNIFLIASLTILGLLLVGFLIGYYRSWKRSLVRFFIDIGIFLVSLFTAPAISNVVIDNFTNGTSLTLPGLTFDFYDMLSKGLSPEIASDLELASGTTESLIISIMHVAINVVIFLLVFILLSMLSMLIFWITCAVIKHNRKKNGVEPKEMSKGKKIGLRFVGAGIGTISMVLLIFAFLVPIFGVMNMCNGFVQNTQSESAAAASLNSQNMTSSRLYYTDDPSIGQVETYIATYDDLKTDFDKSPAGVVFNALGITKLGGMTFSYLTTVEHNGLKVNLTDEVVAISTVYEKYRETFIAKEFDITSESDVENVRDIYNATSGSKIVGAYLEDLLPTLCERWSNGEKFFGLELPIGGEMQGIVKEILKVFAVKNVNVINSNINVLFNLVDVLNDYDAIDSLVNQKMDFTEYLKESKTHETEDGKGVIYSIVMTLQSTAQLQQQLPKIFNEVLKMVYAKVVNEDTTQFDNFGEVSMAINYEQEAKVLQKITDDMFTIIDDFGNLGGTEEQQDKLELILKDLVTLGEFIDLTRTSVMLNKPLKTFIDGYIGTLEEDGADENISKIITQLKTTLNEKWGEPNYNVEALSCRFANLFGVLKTSFEIAKDLENSLKDPDQFAQNIEELLTNAAGSVDKETLSGIVDSAVNSLLDGVGEEQKEELKNVAGVVTDVLGSIVENSKDLTEEERQKEAEAVKGVFDIVKEVSESQDKKVSLGETKEQKQEKAKEIVDALSGSNTIMDLIEEASQSAEPGQESPLQKFIGDNGILGAGAESDQDTKDAIQSALDEAFADDAAKKELFEGLFFGKKGAAA